MSFSHHPPRDPLTAVIRSRYPEIHSAKCHCVIEPLTEEMESLQTENILLRKRFQSEVQNE